MDPEWALKGSPVSKQLEQKQSKPKQKKNTSEKENVQEFLWRKKTCSNKFDLISFTSELPWQTS